MKCTWKAPVCRQCPVLDCAAVACPAASEEPTLEIAAPPTGCPTCCSGGLTTQ
jgi:hypothetical protein